MKHIGQKIKEIVEKRGITKSELARRMNMTSTNVHKIFKRETIDTGLLKKISMILEHDFFQYYLEHDAEYVSNVVSDSTTHYKTKKETHIPSVIEELQKENQLLKTELETTEKEFAQKEVDYLKKITKLLEKKKGSH